MATVTHATRERVTHPVRAIEWLTDSTFVIEMAREGLTFEAGQYINVGLPNDVEMREYSLYSAPKDGTMAILVKLVDSGLVSQKLSQVTAGSGLRVEGPFGYFTIPEPDRSKPLLFVSTGTGISPFRSFVRAYPDLSYTLVHGVRYTNELYDWNEYRPESRISCISRGGGGDFPGRTTDWLRKHDIDPESRCYLCGNCDMIYEAYDILRDKGVTSDNIHAEVYF
ncbi:MAG: oxidoreductase [Spirochaetes bacterium]|jgi:ferredoxin--NADP+ reductase/benzoate/toluate 1,2-dioxygenase reductase subunit|nr:oxidoreductase [Spirochaetota bacterium]